MKVFILIFLLLVNTSVPGADQAEDGIYLRAKGKPAQQIMSQDGQKLFLGEKQMLKIQKSELWSQNNGNTRFYLSLTIPYDERMHSMKYTLIVAGTAYRQSRGWGASHKTTSRFHFMISGKKNVKQVSEYMNTPVLYRRHPQHNLLVSFTPSKQEYNIGEEVGATLRIKNVGTNSISFMKGGRYRGSRDNQYAFSARQHGKQVDDIGNSGHVGGISHAIVLKPGEVFKDSISLSKWFAFNKSGEYEIHGWYYLNFNNPDAGFPRIMWEDYASADFTVQIKETNKASNRLEAGSGTPYPQFKSLHIPEGAVTHKAKLAEVKEKAATVTVGMKRSEVEALFPEEDGGLQVPSNTRYYEDPEVKIEIPFDGTGGWGTGNNRVTGRPKIYRERQHAD